MQAVGSYDQWVGRKAVDINGVEIGEIKDIYYDDVSGRPEWVAVKKGLTGRAIVPIAGAQMRQHTDSDDVDLMLGYAKDQIKDAPNVDDADEHLSAEDERELYRHYGFNYEDRDKDKGFGYGKDYGKLRPDIDYSAARYDRERRTWDTGQTEEHVAETTETVPVHAKIEIPVESQVRLRRYQTQQTRTETRQVEVPVTETQEHVEVVDVDSKTGKPRNA